MRRFLLVTVALGVYPLTMLIVGLSLGRGTSPSKWEADAKACDTAMYSLLRDKLFCDDGRRSCNEALDYCHELLEECQ